MIDEWDTRRVHQETEKDRQFGQGVAEVLLRRQAERKEGEEEADRRRADKARDDINRTFHLHITNWSEMPKVEGLEDIASAILCLQSATSTLAWEMRRLGLAVLIGAGIVGLMIVVAAIIMRGG